jgi:hypothetical protein
VAICKNIFTKIKWHENAKENAKKLFANVGKDTTEPKAALFGSRVPKKPRFVEGDVVASFTTEFFKM